MSLLVVYLLTNWMPTLIQQASGASLADAGWMAAMFQAGGTLGAIVVGRLMDTFEPHGVLCSIYLAGSACVILISLSAKTPAFMTFSVFAAGLCVSGGQVAANALSPSFYPTPYRATRRSTSHPERYCAGWANRSSMLPTEKRSARPFGNPQGDFSRRLLRRSRRS
jgi:AAHS family 4-hydroxybenzoate transporter-like MFS transporter